MPSTIITSVHMGLGHLRAAHALHRHITSTLFIEGQDVKTEAERAVWRDLKKTYYLLSKIGSLPLIGHFFDIILNTIEHIEPLYPSRPLSGSTPAVLYLEYLLEHKKLSRTLIELLHDNPSNIITTFYATAAALDRKVPNSTIYSIICDTDFNRVWVPRKPALSHIHYCTPCEKAARRLRSYGVSDENISITGFPLPMSNIGSNEEIVTTDTIKRIMRLDRKKRITNSKYIDLKRATLPRESQTAPITLLFAVGGAGAQTDNALDLLVGLKPLLSDGSIKLILSAGINDKVLKRFHQFARTSKCDQFVGSSLEFICESEPMRFFDRFNEALRSTDLIITKPSELVFFAGLGIPFLLTRPIGPHESENLHWLEERHAGIGIRYPLKYIGEWLCDFLDDGIIASMAWDAFQNIPRSGTRNVENLLSRNT